MVNFTFIKTKLQGLYLIAPKPKVDNRGYFERLFCTEEFKEVGLNKPIVNINHSFSKQKGTVRGFHFQYSPFQEVKIIICLKGSIYDVAVDIRTNSPTFLQWHGEILDGESKKMFLLPEGFAHGFQTIENDVELLYLHTNFYNKEHESGLNYMDPILNIKLPLNATQVSERDKNHKFISPDFKGVQP